MNNIYWNILTLFIAGLIAIYQAKLNIVTNTRIKRIEVLRELISDYVSEVSNIITIRAYIFEDREELDGKNYSNLSQSEKDKWNEKYIAPYDSSSINLNKLSSKIHLYLDDKTEITIKDIIYENTKMIGDRESLNRDEINSNINNLVDKASEIFSKELKRRKKFLYIINL
jgi:hypothetical protein